MKWLAFVFRVEELRASDSPQGSGFLCVCVCGGVLLQFLQVKIYLLQYHLAVFCD